MTEQAKSESKPFPGSPTGNRSGVGAERPEPETTAGKKPTEPYPGSPTGNASGTGETAGSGSSEQRKSS